MRKKIRNQCQLKKNQGYVKYWKKNLKMHKIKLNNMKRSIYNLIKQKLEKDPLRVFKNWKLCCKSQMMKQKPQKIN